MLAFESALARAQASVGPHSGARRRLISRPSATSSRPISPISPKARRRTAWSLPRWSNCCAPKVGAPHDVHVHRGATSQDVIDTSLVLRLKPVLALFETRLRALIETLRALEASQGAIALMGRTRMQRALPIHAADKLRGWREPLERHVARLDAIDGRACSSSNLAARSACAAISTAKARRSSPSSRGCCSLRAGPCWHVERDALAELASWCFAGHGLARQDRRGCRA